MERYNANIDTKDYKFNVVIESNVSTFTFYDCHTYNTYMLQVDEALIECDYKQTLDNFIKVIKHCIDECVYKKCIEFQVLNGQIEIVLHFDSIMVLDIVLKLYYVKIKSVESSKKALKLIDNKIDVLCERIEKLENINEEQKLEIIKMNHIELLPVTRRTNY